jgi:hypothetical protein
MTRILGLLLCGIFVYPLPASAFRNNLMFWKKVSTLPPFTWTGKGGNANWSTGGNWAGGVAPGASDIAIFDNDSLTTCAANCSPTIDANLNIGGINMKTGFGGTITQGAYTITVGSSGWTMVAGTFAGGSADITDYGDFSLTGGSFTSTSGYLSFPGPFGSLATLTIANPSYFTHHSGTVSFGTDQYGDGNLSVGVAGVDFYHVTIARASVDRVKEF